MSNNSADSYSQFLNKKRWETPPCGLESIPELNPALFPFQRDIVQWALRRGRAAIFADCGLGKTPMQLEWANVISRTTERPALVLAPLAVAAQTVAEGTKFGINVTLCREQSHVRPGVNIANYEMLHKFDPSTFVAVVLDESSILKAFDGKTKATLIESFAQTPYKLACTATPAPNDHVELGNHSEFLGVMKRVEMLASFFVHDGGDTSVWRLKGHAEDIFWSWVCSWAMMLRKPSDLGYDDAGFALPECKIIEHIIPSDKPAEGMLFAISARGLDEQRKARRATIAKRVAKVAELANNSDEPWLAWCELNDESDALTKSILGAVEIAGKHDNETKESRMMGFTRGEHRVVVTKPSLAGFGMNWQHCNNMAFVGLSHSYEQFYQAVRRCWRFGQTKPVNVHVVSTDIETEVLANIKRKESDSQRMAREMVAHMRALNMASLRGTRREQDTYNPTKPIRFPEWLVSKVES